MPTNFKQRNIETESKKSNVLFRLIKLFIWIWIIFFIFGIYNYSSFTNSYIIENETILNIESNDNFKTLRSKVDWLDNLWYDIYLNQNEPDFILRKWTYRIPENSNISELFEALKTPIVDEMNLTILEWWNIFDIDEYLADLWLIEEKEYIEYVENTEKIIQLWEFYNFIGNQETLEWFLYPDTYRVSTNFKINNFVIQQLDNFENRVYSTIFSEYDIDTINDVVNLASIVEKEERVASEKPIVAWILKKRLNNWWMIWADITVCYPYRLTSEECKMVVSKYIRDQNEYNTRTKTWLPKTPISNPNYETLNATLNDQETEYWYYLHNTSTWQIYYAKTNAEHESNKARYLN